MEQGRVFCKFCKAELLSDSDQELGYHIDCWNEMSNVNPTDILSSGAIL